MLEDLFPNLDWLVEIVMQAYVLRLLLMQLDFAEIENLLGESRNLGKPSDIACC
jgi:hypothetical protein